MSSNESFEPKKEFIEPKKKEVVKEATTKRRNKKEKLGNVSEKGEIQVNEIMKPSEKRKIVLPKRFRD